MVRGGGLAVGTISPWQRGPWFDCFYSNSRTGEISNLARLQRSFFVAQASTRLIDFIKPMSTDLNSAINKSQQH